MTETQGDQDVRIVLDHDQRLLAPDVSRADLETLLHPDFTEVIPSGQRLTRSQIISVLTASADRDPSPRKAVELRGVRLSDSMIMVTYVSEQGDPAGPPGHPVAEDRAELAGLLPPVDAHGARELNGYRLRRSRAQVRHRVAVGRAASRSGAIGWPQTSQHP
jgi:hypothetical protein